VRTFLVVSCRRVLAYELFVKIIPRVTYIGPETSDAACEWSNCLLFFMYRMVKLSSDLFAL
jgi:hypothetical protein